MIDFSQGLSQYSVGGTLNNGTIQLIAKEEFKVGVPNW